jgi:hypothetical protein
MTAGVWFVCLGLIAGARAIGRSHAAPETYLAPGDCSQPCWQGMRPGGVNAETLHQYISLIGHFKLGWSDGNDEGSYDDGVARRFSLYPQDSLTFGDALRVFGPPEVTYCLRVRESATGWTSAAEVRFASGTVQMVVENERGAYMSPDMRIVAINYYWPYWALSNPDPQITAWRGFAGTSVYACTY